MNIFPVRFMIYTYIRHYDILSLTLYFFIIVRYIFSYHRIRILLLLLLLLCEEDRELLAKYLKLICSFPFWYATYYILYIYHVFLFYHFYHERWPLVRRWRHAIAASECSKYTGVHTTKTKSNNFMYSYYIISETYISCVGGSFDRVFYFIRLYSFDKLKLHTYYNILWAHDVTRWMWNRFNSHVVFDKSGPVDEKKYFEKVIKL